MIRIKRQTRLNQLEAHLKNKFVGIDTVIDQVMSAMQSWYLLPALQRRPKVINLWGMTGFGKTDLVREIVRYLQFDNAFAEFEMGENGNVTYPTGQHDNQVKNGSIRHSLTSELKHFNRGKCVLFFDEFQFGQTIDAFGNHIGEENLRIVWELLDSGKVKYFQKSDQWSYQKLDDLWGILEDCKEANVRIERGTIKSGIEKAYHSVYSSSLSSYIGGKKLGAGFFYKKAVCDLILKTLPQQFEDWKEVRSRIRQMDLVQIQDLVENACHSRAVAKSLDLSKALIFVAGNLDDAFPMHDLAGQGIQADLFHDLASQVNLMDIMESLRGLFREEQIARLGNTHIIYPALKAKDFETLINRHLLMVVALGIKNGKSIRFGKELKKMLQTEAVIPAQGVRPLLTYLKSLIDDFLPKVLMLPTGENEEVSWDYNPLTDQYIFKVNKKEVATLLVRTQTFAMRQKQDLHELTMTAIHETGHVFAHILAMRIAPKHVQIESFDKKVKGLTFLNYPKYHTRKMLEEEIQVCYGGIVAEELFFGTKGISDGCSNDLKNLTELASAMVKQWGMDSFRATISRDVEEDGVIQEMPTHQKRVEKILAKNYKKIDALMKKNKSAIRKFALVLLEKRHLTQKEIQLTYDKSMGKPTSFIAPEDYYEIRGLLEG